jgi:hypothetical protein
MVSAPVKASYDCRVEFWGSALVCLWRRCVERAMFCFREREREAATISGSPTGLFNG